MASRLTLSLLGVCFLWGCASSVDEVNQSGGRAVLHDNVFPSYRLFTPESKEEIFALNHNAKNFVTAILNESDTSKATLENLVSDIFHKSEEGLAYRGQANYTANQAFENQEANCLSLSIMTFALARYAGYDAQFYQVDIPEYWTRQQGFSLLNGHINLRVIEPALPNVATDRYFVDVDFDPQAMRQLFPRVPVSRDKVVAMFYTNKGADALIQGSYTKAYAYLRAAVKLAPDFGQAWVNLGVLYRKAGHLDYAEQAYNQVLSIEPDNLTALENKAILYAFMGKEDEAAAIRAGIKAKRANNPFYHYILGEQAFDAAQFDEALIHFRQSLRLDNRRHEALFGMGKTYWLMGEADKAEEYLSLAEKYAPNQDEARRYGNKLSVLQSAD